MRLVRLAPPPPPLCSLYPRLPRVSMAPRALLTGCDGVLVLAPPTGAAREAARRATHLAATREAAAAHGLSYSEADGERFAGVAAACAYATLAQEQGRPGLDVAALCALKVQLQKRHSSGTLVEAGCAFVRHAAATGALVSVCCDARAPEHVAAVLLKAGLQPCVRCVLSRDDAPDLRTRLLAACAQLGCEPREAHLLEASDGALLAAAELGLSTTDARQLEGYPPPPPPPPRRPDPPRLVGTVKSYALHKNYGFITPQPPGPDVFVFQTDICRKGTRCLTPGETVEYWLHPPRQDGRHRACKVTSPGDEPWEDRPQSKKGQPRTKDAVTAEPQEVPTGMEEDE